MKFKKTISSLFIATLILSTAPLSVFAEKTEVSSFVEETTVEQQDSTVDSFEVPVEVKGLSDVAETGQVKINYFVFDHERNDYVIIPGTEKVLTGKIGETLQITDLDDTSLIRKTGESEVVVTTDLQEVDVYYDKVLFEDVKNEEVNHPDVGPYISDGSLVRLTKKGYNIYSDFNWKVKNTTDKLYNYVLEARGRYEHKNGNVYYSLYDAVGKWQGFLNVNATTMYKEGSNPIKKPAPANAQGPYISDGRTVKITKANYSIYQNFNWKVKSNTNNIIGKEFVARGRYEHANGHTYYSIFDSQGVWQGYIDAAATTEVKKNNLQGPYISDGRTVKIVKGNYGIYQNFNWKIKSNSSNVLGQEFVARGRYEHANGSTYYSLFDSQGVWQGYINASATTVVQKPNLQGPYISDGRTVKISKSNYAIYQNFNWKIKSNSTNVLGQEFVARGRYEHANGSTYYSLFDSQGVWQGYINAVATTEVKKEEGLQGPYISDGRYVQVTTPGKSIYQNFNWKIKQSTDAVLGKIFQARGRYEHKNGSVYYSIYDDKGVWQGYITAVDVKVVDPQGTPTTIDQKMTVIKSGFTIFSSFNWVPAAKSDDYLNKIVVAKQRYNHMNGTTYYSIYAETGVWIGYISSEAVALNYGDASEIQAELLSLVNNARLEAGVKPVALHPTLSAAANIRAEEITRSFDHKRPNGSSFSTAIDELVATGYANPGTSVRSENIAYFITSTSVSSKTIANKLFTQWMNSPAHKANMLDVRLKYAGFGFYTSPKNGTMQYSGVQLFTEQ